MAPNPNRLHNRSHAACRKRHFHVVSTDVRIESEDGSVSDLAGFPAWYWQVLGVLCGLALGILLGAIRMRRRATQPAEAQPQAGANGSTPAARQASANGTGPSEADRLPRVMVPPPSAPKQAPASVRANGPEAPAHAGKRGKPAATAPNASRSGSPGIDVTAAPAPNSPPSPPRPAAAPAVVATSPAAATPPASSGARQAGSPSRPNIAPPAAAPLAAPPSAGAGTPGLAEPAPPAAAPPPAAPDAVAVLQEYTAELLEQLRNTHSSHAQELQTRAQQTLEERRRHEGLLEGLRQEHSAELSRLMATLTEQVDQLHQQYGQRIRQLEADIERLRMMGTPTTVSPAELPARDSRAPGTAEPASASASSPPAS